MDSVPRLCASELPRLCEGGERSRVTKDVHQILRSCHCNYQISLTVSHLFTVLITVVGGERDVIFSPGGNYMTVGQTREQWGPGRDQSPVVSLCKTRTEQAVRR